MKSDSNPRSSELAVREWKFAVVANNGSCMPSFGWRAGAPSANPTASPRRFHAAKRLRRSQMKNDVDDIPIIYLFYVLLAILAIVVIAAFVIFRLIKP